MKRIQFLSVLIGILCSVQTLFAQYSGGDNDGFAATIGCIQNLNGGSAFIAGPIIGSTQFCPSSTEAYSITVSGVTSTTVYNWTAPAGSTITSGQGTNSIVITFGGIAGNISVDVGNECETLNQVLPVTLASCTFFAGGNNDGFTNTIGCIQNLNGGSAFIAGPIIGSTQFCPSSTEAYSITVAGVTSTTVYNWTAPVGSTITSGQGTNSIVITFGAIAGNISVDVSNECETVNQVLPVTLASCTFFAGGNNDGFTTNVGCIQNLNGGSAFIAGPIIGSTQFCPSSTEAYSITVAGSTSTTVYNWTVPAGSSITSGQGTNSIVITFGGTNGNISVDVSNDCEIVNVSLAVSSISCIFYKGGSNDGFSVTTVGSIPLPIELVSFEAKVESGMVRLSWATASELNNDFFEVEKSAEGEKFLPVARVQGSGTTSQGHKYFAIDDNPFTGSSYYRLSQTDFDGTKSYSGVIQVDVEATAKDALKLYPNPVRNGDLLHFDYFSEIEETIKISFVSPSGLNNDSKEFSVSRGENKLSFRPDFDAKGVYIIHVQSSKGDIAVRLIVL